MIFCSVVCLLRIRSCLFVIVNVNRLDFKDSAEYETD